MACEYCVKRAALKREKEEQLERQEALQRDVQVAHRRICEIDAELARLETEAVEDDL